MSCVTLSAAKGTISSMAPFAALRVTQRYCISRTNRGCFRMGSNKGSIPSQAGVSAAKIRRPGCAGYETVTFFAMPWW